MGIDVVPLVLDEAAPGTWSSGDGAGVSAPPPPADVKPTERGCDGVPVRRQAGKEARRAS